MEVNLMRVLLTNVVKCPTNFEKKIDHIPMKEDMQQGPI